MHPGGLILRLCGYVVVQSRLRWTTKSPPRWGSREGANWGAVVRIAAASAVTLTRPATRGADDGPHSGSDAYGCLPVPNGSSPSIDRHVSSGMTGGDPHGRRPFERGAVSIQGRP